MKVSAIPFLQLMFVLVCHASIYYSGNKHEILENGTVVSYCEVSGYNGKIYPGTSFRFNCFDCHCDEYMMSCSGVGSSGGVYAFEGCKQVETDDCCVKFVKNDDPEEVCMNECPEPHENELD